MRKIKKIVCLVIAIATVFAGAGSIAKAAEINKEFDYSNKSLYILGDSIIEGKGNDYIGVGDLLATEGATVIADLSEHGDLITNVPYSKENYKRGNIYSQVAEIQNSVAKNGYDENTIVILDGGTNDLLKFYKESKKEPAERYFNITLFENNNSDHDMESAIRYTLESLIQTYGNDDISRGYQVPILFIIPTREDIINGEASDYISYMESSLVHMKSIVEEYEVYGVVAVDTGSNYTSECFADHIHPNALGYEKMLELIDSVLKERR